MRGILNIIVGIVFIVGGLAGKLVMVGTNSGVALAGLGLVLVILGIWRLTRQRGGSVSSSSGPRKL